MTNINNEKPEFINTPYNFTLYENIPPDMMPIGRISVVDKDGDHVNVTLIGDNKGNFFLHTEYNSIILKDIIDKTLRLYLFSR